MADTAWYKNTEFPLDLLISNELNLIFLVTAINNNRAPPVFSTLTFSSRWDVRFLLLSLSFCISLFYSPVCSSSDTRAQQHQQHYPSYRMTSSSSSAIGRGEWQSMVDQHFSIKENDRVLTLCALMQVSLSSIKRGVSSTKMMKIVTSQNSFVWDFYSVGLWC